MSLKKAWITDYPSGRLYVLSLESAEVEPAYERLNARDMAFPATPTPEYPLRHVITVGLLSEEDLVKIRDSINEALKVISE